MYSARTTEQVSLCGTIQPIATFSATPYKTDAIDLSKYRRVRFTVLGGVIGSSGTIDFSVYWSATASGTYAQVASTPITQDVAGGKAHVEEISAEQVFNQVGSTVGFVKGYLTIGVANTPCAVVAEGFEPTYFPVNNDAAAIGQVVAAVA